MEKVGQFPGRVVSGFSNIFEGFQKIPLLLLLKRLKTLLRRSKTLLVCSKTHLKLF